MITGATSGIGKATAEVFAREGISLIICGRRLARLEALQQKLAEQVPVHVLPFDIRLRDAVDQAITSLPSDFKKIDILVNNAGNAHGRDPIHRGDPHDWDNMIDLNLKGLLHVSQAIIPGMVVRGKGHVINIGSLAGKEVYPQGNVYCATKYAVDALSQAMRIDLNGTGVRVSAINPGLVETEFSLVRFKGDEAKSDAVYRGYTPLTAYDVAEVIWFAASRPPHVNIADLLLLPTDQATSMIVHKRDA